MKRTTILLMIFGIIMQLTGCGGGGGGGAVVTNQKSTAAVTLTTTGTLPTTVPATWIGGIDIILTLPAGVTIKSDPSPSAPTDPTQNVPSAGVIVLKTTTVDTQNYTYNKTANTLKIQLLSTQATGIIVGDLLTVNCDIAVGSVPTATSFAVASGLAGSTTGVIKLSDGQNLDAITVKYTAVLN